MPVRNAAPWLAEAVESVLSQSEGRFELLAVDDGSSDASADILHALAARDSRVRLLSTPGDRGGIVAALNAALGAAHGSVLARMDADDVMHPSRLALQLAALEREPALFAVTCRAEGFPQRELGNGMREYLQWQNEHLAPHEIAMERFVESPALHPTLMMRTAVLRETLGGWHERGWPEDWDLLMRAFEAGLDMRRLQETLLQWRLHGAQATRTDSRYDAASLLRLRAHYLARFLRSAMDGRALWILGAGPVGKSLVKALADQDVVAAGLADVDARKIGGVVRGRSHRWPVVSHTHLGELAPRPFAVSAVSGAEARRRIRGLLAEWGWSEGRDFVVAA